MNRNENENENDIMQEEASTTRTLRNIRNALRIQLQDEYGIKDKELENDILKIHGLSKKNFDFVTNMETLISSKLNDVSIDANGNKNEKTIMGIMGEATSPVNKAVGYDYLYRQMVKDHGKKEAKRLSGLMYDYSLPLHDSGKILVPYSYYKNTPIYVKINDKEQYITIGKLFEIHKKYSQKTETMEYIKTHDIKQDVLFTRSFMNDNSLHIYEDVKIEVWDNGKFVNVEQLTKHKHDNEKDFIVYQTENGDYAFVTEDHPVILKDNSEVYAKDLKEGTEIKDAIYDIPNVKEKINVSKRLAYFIGLLLGDKNLVEYDEGENFLQWKKESKSAFIAGLIDSDGTINKKDKKASIRLKSYATINVLYDALNMLKLKGVIKRITSKEIDKMMFEVSFNLNEQIYDMSEKAKLIDKKELVTYHPQYITTKRSDKITKICRFKRTELNKNSFIFNETEYVYDITTETGTFTANGMVQHNCWSFDASKIVFEGRPFGQLKSKPPKHIVSYVASLNETIHQMSNHLAGAIAIGSFFSDLAFILINREHVSFFEAHTSKSKYIENAMQMFVHSVNHLSRVSNESPFTNISIFDKPKLQALFAEDNMGWILHTEEGEIDSDYFFDYIRLLQEIFLDFFDKGDPSESGMPYRFPVCFKGDTVVYLNGKMSKFEELFSNYNDGWTTVNEMFTEYKGEKIKVNKVYKGKTTKLIKIKFDRLGTELQVSPEHKFVMEDGSLKKACELVKGDKLEFYNKIDDSDNFIEISKIEIEDIDEVVYNIEVDTNEHKYSLPCGISTSNCTINLSKDKQGNITDIEFFEAISKREIFRYNIYTSEGTKVASCCFDGDEKCLIRTSDKGAQKLTLEEAYNTPRENNNFKVYHDGSFVNGNPVKIPVAQRDMYTIKTANNKEFIAIDNHLHVTLRGDIPTDKLQLSDYLMFNTSSLKGKANNQKENTNYSKSIGILIGAYLGDGSNVVAKKGQNHIIFSLNLKKKDILLPHFKNAIEELNINTNICINKQKNNVWSIAFHNNEVYNFIKKFVSGNYSYDKSLSMQVLNESLAFREGIIEGYYATDGGNSNRIYSTSKKLIEDMEAVFNSVGKVITIDYIDRTNEKVIIRGEEFNRNYPTYCIRWYDRANKRSQKDVYKYKNGNIYFKITSIKKLEKYDKKYVYCFEMRDKEEPYFTLANGLVTHNCRLLSDTEMFKLGGQVNSFGGSALSLGSHRVSLVHTNRIALEVNTKEEFYELLETRLEDATKILISHRNLITQLTKAGLQPFIEINWITMQKMFSTIGLVAIPETIKTLGDSSVEELLVFVNNKVNELALSNHIPMNIEQVPAETMAVRLVQVDKMLFGKEKVPYELYSNQFIPLWEEASLFERMDTDGKYNKLFTGGGIVHFNLGEKPTPTQNRELISYAVKSGCEHFALNAVYSKCENGHTTFSVGDKCPVCGAQIIEKLTRVVGFFTPIGSWNPVRREWEFPRRNFTSIE